MMNAIEFIKQLRRMIEQGVPRNRFIYPCVGTETDSPEEVVAEVEEWAKAHPIKTRQSVFLEQYPGAQIDDNDVLCVCPAVISPSHRKDGDGCLYIHKECADCRREFWLVDVQE